jgi:hypothetical protein
LALLRGWQSDRSTGRKVQAVGYIFPSYFAIGGLWILATMYFTMAVISAFLLKRRQAHA